jgi:D-alanine-D-alanine ligase-like ATP-grasp enzyme
MVTYPSADEVELGYYVYSAHLLALEVMRRGGQVEWINRSFFITQRDGQPVGFWCTRSNATSFVAAQATSRKDVTQRLLRRAGVAVAPGRSFERSRRQRALRYGPELGFPLVVKPATGSKGTGITTNIQGPAELERAWELAAACARYVLIERHFRGRAAGRFLVVGRDCVAVSQRIPMVLTGDGVRTVSELIAAENHARQQVAHQRKRLIAVDEGLDAFLAGSGRQQGTVLALGEELALSQTANTSRGALTEDITDAVHPSYRAGAVRATSVIPGLSIAGVDILADDLGVPATPENHIVVELNSMPGIRSHHFPDRGRPRDAARAIVDHVFATVDAEQRAGLATVPAVTGADQRQRRQRFGRRERG